MRILLTGVGCPGTAGTIYSLRNNPSGVTVNITGIDTSCEAVGKLFCNKFYQVPFPESPDYIPTLKKLIVSQRIDIVIPQTTREVVVLSQQKQKLDCAVMVDTYATLQLYNSKYHLLNMCEKYNLPHSEYHSATNKDTFAHFVKELGYPDVPVVVKPAIGSGGRGVRIIDATKITLDKFMQEKPEGMRITLEEAVHVLDSGDYWPEMLVMEYLPGQEYSVDVLNTPNTRIIISRKRNQIRSGISFITETVDNQQISNQVSALLDNHPLYGAIGFQFKENENGVPCILECNPRVQGTMIAAHMAGSNIIWGALEYFSFGEVITPVVPPTPGVKFYRYWGGACRKTNGVVTI